MKLHKLEIRPVDGNMTAQEISIDGVKLNSVTSLSLGLVAGKQIPMVTIGVLIDPNVTIEQALVSVFPAEISEAMERSLLAHLLSKYASDVS